MPVVSHLNPDRTATVSGGIDSTRIGRHVKLLAQKLRFGTLLDGCPVNQMRGTVSKCGLVIDGYAVSGNLL